MTDTKQNNKYYNIIEKDNSCIIKLYGEIFISNSSFYQGIISELSPDKNLILDCSDVKEYDSYFVLIVKKLLNITEKQNTRLEIVSMSKELESFYQILSPEKVAPKLIKAKKHPFVRWAEFIGGEVMEIYEDFHNFITFVGELILKTLNLLIHPKDMRWKDFPSHFTKTGVNALPIVILILFLIGIITGYQGALQLKQFGADIYIADLIGVSLTRELTPLMVAILVAGRSGSAFAAEIGTMKVSEEIDALESMGFDSMKFLVLPRVLAVTFAMPILVMICNLVGIAGGLVAALSTLDITITGYVNQLQNILNYYDVFSGVIKSIVFGFMIATVGCYRGLQVKGGAESVGRYTTASVVTGVFLIIFTDAIFVFILQALGI